MRVLSFITLLAVCLLAVPAFAVSAQGGGQPARRIESLPTGITLPVSLDQTLNRKHTHPGEKISASLYQRVPLNGDRYLSRRTKLIGKITAVDAHTLALRFDQLQCGSQLVPVNLRLVAAAQWMAVEDTKIPLSGPDRGEATPADWTTRQVGRDQVDRFAGSGLVYNQYSEKVGKADLHGVYAAPASPGGLWRAMGPFSSSSTGLYNLPSLQIASEGGAGQPITFHLTGRKWQLHTSDALLLEVVPPDGPTPP